MLRSMYSGISGLRNFQTKLDVIGNNIANVNTYGFKKGRTVFKDLVSQSVEGASGATNSRGGVNPKQVGLGSQISAIDTLHSQGSTQFTGNVLDLAISGDGFFQVADGTGATATTEPTGYTNVLYTRAGNFYMDEAGLLVNSDGKYLMGFSASAETTFTPAGGTAQNITIHPTADQITAGFNFTATNGPKYGSGNNAPGTINAIYKSQDLGGGSLQSATLNVSYKPIKIPPTAQSMSIAQDGTVSYVDEFGTLRWAGQLTMSKFSNPGGLEKVGGNYFQESSNSGNPSVNFAAEGGNGTVQSGFLEMSNVDLAEEFTEMIVAQRGFQANTRIITTSDEILQELVNLKR